MEGKQNVETKIERNMRELSDEELKEVKGGVKGAQSPKGPRGMRNIHIQHKKEYNDDP